jgi:hypothetical protein
MPQAKEGQALLKGFPNVTGVIGEPVFPSALIPQDEDGCYSSYDYNRVVCASYRHAADSKSNLFLRFYNEALDLWLRRLIVIDGRHIICVKSTPMRAFSTYKEILNNSLGQSNTPIDGSDIERFPLPFCNWTRGDVTPNAELQQNSFPIRNIGFLDEDNKRRTAWSRYPKALNISYQIDFWTKYDTHMDYITQRIHEQFLPVAVTYVRHPFAAKDFVMTMHMESLTDNSDLEQGDTEDRLLRSTLTLRVEAWQFFDIRQAPTFTHLTQEYLNNDEALTEALITVLKSPDGSTIVIPSFIPLLEQQTSELFGRVTLLESEIVKDGGSDW